MLKTIIDRPELRPNGLRMILSLVPLTPAATSPNRLQGCVFPREFPLRIKRRGVEMRFAIDAPDPRATNPDPVLLKDSWAEVQIPTKSPADSEMMSPGFRAQKRRQWVVNSS